MRTYEVVISACVRISLGRNAFSRSRLPARARTYGAGRSLTAGHDRAGHAVRADHTV